MLKIIHTQQYFHSGDIDAGDTSKCFSAPQNFGSGAFFVEYWMKITRADSSALAILGASPYTMNKDRLIKLVHFHANNEARIMDYSSQVTKGPYAGSLVGLRDLLL